MNLMEIRKNPEVLSTEPAEQTKNSEIITESLTQSSLMPEESPIKIKVERDILMRSYEKAKEFMRTQKQQIQELEVEKICFSGPNVMKGYYNNIEQTKEILREHKDGKLWIHSGDIGMMDEDGFLYVIDRIKRIIDTKDGRKILPSKVEKVIREMSGVSKCVVVSGNLDRGYVLRAFVVLEDENLKISKIKRDLEEQLPKWMLPVLVEQISDLPLTPVGKVDYLALEKIE